jgi:hypothetical protein
MSQSELAIEVIGCMVEVLADDDGNIDQKCFEKVFTACLKAVVVTMKVGDQALLIMQQVLSQVIKVRDCKISVFQLKTLTFKTIFQGGLEALRKF